MTEFKVTAPDASARNRERNVRLIGWGVVVLMSALALFSVYGARSASPQVVRTLTWLAIVIGVAAIAGAYFLAARLGLERFEHNLIFVLTEKGVVRKLPGWPDVEIGFSEIKALYQRHGWLVVESNEPQRRVAIPERVQGFGSLRAELVKHSPIVAAPRRSPIRFAPMVASLVCWGLVLWSKDAGVVMAAAAVALLFLGWESFRLFAQLRRSPKRLVLYFLIGLTLLAAALLVYLRVIRAP
jgi:hypothetical protein